MADAKEKAAAAYVPWATLKKSVEQLGINGIPNQIDRTVFPGMAWTVQTQLLAAMKFLGLIDDAKKPTAVLEQFANDGVDDEKRKELWLTLLCERYAEVVELDLDRTTPAELDQKFTQCYGVTGSTKTKAIRFFLSAMEYTGASMSPLLLSKNKNGKKGAPSGASHAARKRATRVAPKSGDAPIFPAGASKTIQLKSGGTLTLSASLDLFALHANDRKFIFDLIDKLETYDSAKPM